MPESKKYLPINRVTVGIIDSTIWVGAILGFIAFSIGLLNYSDTASKLLYLLDFCLITALFAVAIFRKKLSIEIKSIIIILSITIIVIIDVIRLGVYSDNKTLLVIIPFYAYLVYNQRTTILIFSSIIFVFLFTGYLHYFEIIPIRTDILKRVTKINPWYINAILIGIVSFVVAVIMKKYNIVYTKLITDLEESNKQISEKERNYREIFDASTDAIFIHDLKGQILDVNSSMLSMYGYSKKEGTTLTLTNLSSGKDGYTVENAAIYIEKTINGKPQVFDWQAKKKNGDVFWVEVALKKIEINSKERVLAVVRDIDTKKRSALQLALYKDQLEELVGRRTQQLEDVNLQLSNTNFELKKQKQELIGTLNKLESTQEHLIDSEKMASLGILAASVAHEVNNPLNFIKGGATGLESYLENYLPEHIETFKPLLNAINEGVNRATDIVTSLNHFSRKGHSKNEICDMHIIIDNCITMLRNKVKHRIEIKQQFCTDSFILYGNEGRLHQVVLNILTNSIQAIKEKGEILIKTRLMDQKLHVSIKDNGVGVSKEELDKIFTPFYTTKEAGDGTGLGLSISLKILKEHNGNLEYTSEKGKGTEAIITLPVELPKGSNT